MKICNVYSFDLPSAGDRYCAPMQYFDFPFEMNRSTVVDPEKYDFFIFGGGGHIHIPAPDYNGGRFGHLEAILPFAERIIVWGIGHNVHDSRDIKYPEYMDEFLLTGYRDIQRKDWVACPSCMHAVFSKKYRAKDDCRAFFKKGKLITGDFESLQDNGDLTIEEAVRFLGGGKTILTNSYHGAFWALLLGREVIIIAPYSSKFYGILENGKERDGDIHLSPPPGYLKKCRESNEKFYRKVIGILK